MTEIESRMLAAAKKMCSLSDEHDSVQAQRRRLEAEIADEIVRTKVQPKAKQDLAKELVRRADDLYFAAIDAEHDLRAIAREAA